MGPLIAAPSLPRHRLGATALGLAGLLLCLLLLLVMGVFGAIFGLRPLFSGGYEPSGLARAEIPTTYLKLYIAAGRRYGLDPWVLAGIGWVETQHGRSQAPGVHSGVNSFGCCAGPMQFSLVGSPSTWDSYGTDGDHDGQTSPYDPADAIPAAAKYLRASGAPRDYRQALFAYNHATWYVDQVLAKAAQYRGAARAGTPTPANTGTAQAVLANPRIMLTELQRNDVRSGVLDQRVLSLLTWIGRRHRIIITALKSDHGTFTVDGNVSNHSAGRAIDIGAVDGQTCTGTRTGRCADLARDLANLEGPLRATELIYCFDPDGPNDPRGFARADHCDHIHAGWDG